MHIDIFHTTCFLGRLPKDFSFDENHIEYLRLEVLIEQAIYDALNKGYHTFLCSMEEGFPLLCADILLDIREQKETYRNLRLVAVQPYTAHTHSGFWGPMHHTVQQCADQIVITSLYPQAGGEQIHRSYLLEHASHFICYYGPDEKETARLESLAQSETITHVNIAEEMEETHSDYTVH